MADYTAIELSMIDLKKKVRVDPELVVDRRKLISKELSDIYEKLGRIYVSQDTKQKTSAEKDRLFKLAKAKEAELLTIEDSPNDVTSTEELVSKLAAYVLDHFSGKADGVINSQVAPLMTRVMAQALSQFLGEEGAVILLSSAIPRQVILYSMVVSFTLYNLLKTHGIKIVTSEEEVTDEELAQIREFSEINARRVSELFSPSSGSNSSSPGDV